MNRMPFSVVVVGIAVALSACALKRHSETPVLETLNLSSPETTVISFTKVAAHGDAELAQACFLRGGSDHTGIKEVLDATPSHVGYPARIMLESLDPNAPITIRRKTETPSGVTVVWRTTYARGFEMDGYTVKPGMTEDWHAVLKQSGSEWLIDSLSLNWYGTWRRVD